MGSGISNQIAMPVWERSIILDALVCSLSYVWKRYSAGAFETNPATSENYQLHPSGIL